MKTILIDFDGTLANSIPLLYNTYLAFLAGFGQEGNLKEFQELNGPQVVSFIRILQIRYQLEGLTEQLAQSYRNQLEICYKNEVLPFPDAIAVIRKWDQQGRQLGIVTAAHLQLVEIFLNLHLPDIPFIITTGEEVTRSKPDPAIYRLALQKLSLSPQEALALEDSPNGITAARGAGILTFPFRESWNAVDQWVEEHG